MSTTRDISVGWGVTGLAGTLAYRVVDQDDATLIARTASGVTEFPASSGEYHVKIATWDSSWVGRIIWDDGSTAVGHVASESFDAVQSATVVASSVIINSVVDVNNGDLLTLVEGDDHTEGNRLPSWTFSNYDGPSLVGGTGVLRLRLIQSYRHVGTVGSADLEVVANITQSGDVVTVEAPITSTESAELFTNAPAIDATHEYQIIATTTGGKAHTLKFGKANVLRRIPA